jgi:hypothetical protein
VTQVRRHRTIQSEEIARDRGTEYRETMANYSIRHVCAATKRKMRQYTIDTQSIILCLQLSSSPSLTNLNVNPRISCASTQILHRTTMYSRVSDNLIVSSCSSLWPANVDPFFHPSRSLPTSTLYSPAQVRILACFTATFWS